MIRGEKVVLRPIDADADLERCFRWINDLEVTRFLRLQGPISRHREREMLARQRDPNYDIMLAIETEDGTHIGNCGLHDIDRPARTATLGIMVGDKRYWSQGYGTDVVRTLCAFGFAYQNLDRIFLHVGANHVGAVRCYEKAGFQREGLLRRHRYVHGRYLDIIVMGLLREEFQARFPERRLAEE